MRPPSQSSARRRAQTAAAGTPRPQQAAAPYYVSAEAFLKNVTDQRVEQVCTSYLLLTVTFLLTAPAGRAALLAALAAAALLAIARLVARPQAR